MHIPAAFRQTDLAELHRLIHSRPLATLVASTPSGICANHVPLTLTAAEGEPLILRGHIARANPLVHERGQLAALAIFHGPDTYITPSWYPAKAEHGRAVPTWNYVAVHAHGQLRIVDDADWLRVQLQQLTAQQERHEPFPWSLADAPADYVAKLARGIVGVELVVERFEGKWKVSQNQDTRTQYSVAAGLRARNRDWDSAMAELVEAFTEQ